MAYFPNGTSGMIYEEQYCQHCVHDADLEERGGCPILLLHNLYNYDQIGETPEAKALHTVLSVLIPETPDKLGAEKCSMFTPRDDTQDADLRRLAEQPRKYAEAMAETRMTAA